MSDNDFLHAALKAQAKRIRELEQQVRNLGGDPYKAKDGLIREDLMNDKVKSAVVYLRTAEDLLWDADYDYDIVDSLGGIIDYIDESEDSYDRDRHTEVSR